jgi:hypothetical protein
MILNMLTIYALREENNWLLDIIEGLKEDFLKIVNDFGDFFISIKELVYDNLVNKFGAMPINMILIALVFIIVILLFLKLMN